MRRLLMTAAALLAVVPLLGAAEKAGGKGVPQLQGKWRIVKGEENGKPVAAERIKDDFLVVKGNHMRMVATDERRAWEITYTADTAHDPARLTMRVVKGDGKGKTAHGIYTVAGDSLKIAYIVGGEDFPKDFATKTQGEKLHMMFVLQRERPSIR